MNHRLLKNVLFISMIALLIIALCQYFNIKRKNEIIKSDLLYKANNIISDDIVSANETDSNKIVEQEIFSVQEIEQNQNIIGKIKIPKIDVEAPIEEGTTPDVLKVSVGHFSQSNYWNGNVCLASHNRGSYAHYFENLNKLSINDEIIYQTKLGTRAYKVSEIEQISEHDLSVLNDTKENTITLITCITNRSNYRLCVKAIEKV